jgi:hypothetical protein
MESFQLSKLQQSGFETLVQDISDHNYDDTLLIVAPTQDMRTFLFDTRGVALGSYKVQARCFYQWDTDSIFDREANCAGWTSPILVKDFLTKIKTETGHYKCLAITEPHFCPSTHAMPCRQQINQLLSECDHQYRPIRQKDYAGGQESFRLHLYEFKETPASLNSALQPR